MKGFTYITRLITTLCLACVLSMCAVSGALAWPTDEYPVITVTFHNDRGGTASGSIGIIQTLPNGTQQYATGYGLAMNSSGGTTVTSWSLNAADLYTNSVWTEKKYSLPAGTYTFTAAPDSTEKDRFESAPSRTLTVADFEKASLDFVLKIKCYDMVAHTQVRSTGAALPGASYLFGHVDRNGGLGDRYLTGYDAYNRPVYGERSAALLFAANAQGDAIVPRIETKYGMDVSNRDFFFEQVVTPAGYDAITGPSYMESATATEITFRHALPVSPPTNQPALPVTQPPNPPMEPTDPAPSAENAPKTGDNSQPLLWCALSGLALFGIALCFCAKRKVQASDR